MWQVAGEGLEDDPLDLLGRVIDALAAEDVTAMPVSGVRDSVIAMRVLLNRADGELCRRVARVDAAGPDAIEGERSILLWLRNRCGMSIGEAQQRLDVARHLSDLPGAGALLESGEISFRHAAVLARATADCGAAQLAIHGEGLLPAARRVDPDALSQFARQVRHRIDAEASLEDARRAHEARRLALTRRDNLFFLDGVLELEAGAKLRTAIDALSAPRGGDDRTAAQRRADALEEIVDAHLRAGDLPRVAGTRPHLVITCPAETLQRASGAPGGEIAGGGVMPAETARRLACDAAVVAMRLSPEGEPLSVGRERRTWPAAILRAAIARFGGCAVTGDDCPPSWTEGHHGRHWSDGGATELANCYPLCRRHHWAVHEGGKVLVRLAGGAIAVVRPDELPSGAVRVDGRSRPP